VAELEKTLRDKVAVVTGASRGLGLAIAEHIVGLGADVVLIARGRERLDAAARHLRVSGGQVTAIPCDVSQPEQVLRACELIREQMQGVDILINNAGIPAPRTFQETDSEDWCEVIGVNLSGAFHMTRMLWDELCSSGAGYVINISGTAGRRGGTSPSYGSSKFGLTGLTRAIAASGEAHNLRATVIYPGSMDTGWRNTSIGTRPRSETMDPEEVARFIGYLLNTPKEFVVNEVVVNPIADTWA
jgi:NAD(P)-dependent dehydrogenase (short-subunit alcohol dehydrogenase family)